MTREEIKQALKERKMTMPELAERLGVGISTLRNALSGQTPLTAALSNHISLILEQPREAVLVYRIELSDAKVTELCGKKAANTEEERISAMEAIIHHNLQELIELGKKCEWSEEERKFLGIDQ